MKKNDRSLYAALTGISVFLVQLIMELFVKDLISNSFVYVILDSIVLFAVIYGVHIVLKNKDGKKNKS
ncbi:MAG: hypothetical protein RR725_05270 [Carnobacterium sp.]|uniref:hypothetical protein n=1 Tax=Carnobacterium sp. TaxID=48221 RepID=UPI002FC89CDB